MLLKHFLKGINALGLFFLNSEQWAQMTMLSHFEKLK